MIVKIYKEDLYTLLHSKMKALGLVVSEKKIFLFCSHCKSMMANAPWGGIIFDPRDTVCSMYKEDHYTLLHTNLKGLDLVVLKEFFMFFPMMPLWRGLNGPLGHCWHDI